MGQRVLVHKHIQFYNDQVEDLEKLRKDIGARNVAPILRKIMDYFFNLPKEKQKKIVGD